VRLPVSEADLLQMPGFSEMILSYQQNQNFRTCRTL